MIRRDILDLTPYKAGKPIEETKRELGLQNVIKLASNENPLGVSPLAQSAIRKYASSVNRYPDSQGFYLKRELARRLGVRPSNLVLGNGSDEIIDVIIKTFVENDENIVTSEATFLEYAIIARVNGRKVIEVPLKDFGYDLKAIARKINAKTKAVFIANPNNPTGTYVGKDELNCFLRSLPRRVIVVLDEAYDAFIDANDYPSGIRYFRRHNVIVMKTFSKAYGLAGLRIGYAIVKDQLAAYMERVRQPFNVNMLAQAAALAALSDDAFLKKTRGMVLEGKSYLYEELSRLGVPFIPSVANFILIDAGCDGVGLFKRMLKRGVIVRDMQQYGLKNFIRVTIGTRAENRRFIEALQKAIIV